MKTKLLLILLICMSVSIEAAEKKKPSIRVYEKQEKLMSRTPVEYSIETEETNDCLHLIFQFSLDDVDIVIKDKNGNEVVEELQTTIYVGQTIIIQQAKDYPYSFDIVSPILEMRGEIVLEDN